MEIAPVQRQQVRKNLTKGSCGLLGLLMIAGCANQPAGPVSGQLAPCPSKPNCVASGSSGNQRIEPFELAVDAQSGWQQLQRTLESWPRVTVVRVTDDYLHAEARSRFFRFVDDLEFQLQPERKEIAVRSAARLGYSDFGVNRKRIEALRAELQAQGIVK